MRELAGVARCCVANRCATAPLSVFSNYLNGFARNSTPSASATILLLKRL
jgi:hypothetical protein